MEALEFLQLMKVSSQRRLRSVGCAIYAVVFRKCVIQVRIGVPDCTLIVHDVRLRGVDLIEHELFIFRDQILNEVSLVDAPPRKITDHDRLRWSRIVVLRHGEQSTKTQTGQKNNFQRLHNNPGPGITSRHSLDPLPYRCAEGADRPGVKEEKQHAVPSGTNKPRNRSCRSGDWRARARSSPAKIW